MITNTTKNYFVAKICLVLSVEFRDKHVNYEMFGIKDAIKLDSRGL